MYAAKNFYIFFRFHVWLNGLKILVNDEKTRTFIVLKVFRGNKELGEMTSEIDSCLKEYDLPIFYEVCKSNLYCNLI